MSNKVGRDKPCHGRSTAPHLGARALRSANRKTADRLAHLLRTAKIADARKGTAK